MMLRLGDAGPAVRALQRNLNKLGAMILVDAEFGPATRDAVVSPRGPWEPRATGG
jgi:peptidoglycan hydrolase-like protein with peptidoglycan-binding domain